MVRKLQIVFDCLDPVGLSNFYAGALQYIVEPPPEGFKSWEEALKAWEVREEDWELTSAIVDPDGNSPRIFFQKMDTPKVSKNRVHLDLNATGGIQVPLQERKKQVRIEVERLIKLGAKEEKEWEEDREYWVVMLDPEGNEFCVQ